LKADFARAAINNAIHPGIKKGFDVHVSIQIELETDVVSAVFCALRVEAGRTKNLLLSSAYASLWQTGLIAE
jgi:hypothetical protein